MSKYCLMVWNDEYTGSIVYKNGIPFVNNKCASKEYKRAMQNLHPSSEYRLVNVKELKKAVKELKELKED